MWPPVAPTVADPSDPTLSLPQVLVSAARFGVGLTDRPDRARDGTPARPFPVALTDDVPAPRPRAEIVVPDVPIEDVCDTLASAARAHRLPVPFFVRLIWQESRFNPGAISPMGAQGVAQFMPATAAAMGLKNPFDPLEALQHSARLLRELIGQFGNLGLAAAAYNAGPKRIFDWLARRARLPEETRNYVMSITGHAAERWRFTRPGRLALDVPKRAPCKDAAPFAGLVEVPAPPPARKPARSRLPAKGKGKDGEATVASGRKRAIEVSAARKRKQAPQPRVRSAAAGPLRIAR